MVIVSVVAFVVMVTFEPATKVSVSLLESATTVDWPDTAKFLNIAWEDPLSEFVIVMFGVVVALATDAEIPVPLVTATLVTLPLPVPAPMSERTCAAVLYLTKPLSETKNKLDAVVKLAIVDTVNVPACIFWLVKNLIAIYNFILLVPKVQFFIYKKGGNHGFVVKSPSNINLLFILFL